MCPLLHDTSFFENDDTVGVLDGRKPMRDYEHRVRLLLFASPHQVIECRLHCALAFGIERTGGLIQ